MRIIALPLARVKVSRAKIKPFPNFNANTVLVFYHFDLISPFSGREDFSWHKKVLKSVMNKAAGLWTSLGKAPKGSWKVGVFLSKVARTVIHTKQQWTYESGERIADRIDFEEMALRNVDPSLGPTVPLRIGTSKQVNDVRENRSQLHLLPKVSMHVPSVLAWCREFCNPLCT